jgi:predicted MFS family arabinose efflux permease
VSARRPGLTLLAVCLGGAMVGLDGTAVTIAAPYIARSTGASLGELAWIANVYLVALAVGLLPAGRLADRVGRRATFVAGALAFGASSLAIGLTGDVTALIVLRGVQGLAGALLQPAALALLRTAFPGDRLGPVLGVWGGANALAIGLGPVVAGLVVQGFGWPAVFLANLPVAVVTVALVLVACGESRGAGAGAGRSLRRLLTLPGVGTGAVLVAVSSFAIFGLLFLLTLYLQNVHGLRPIAAAAWMLPATMVVVLSAPLGGVLGERLGPRAPVVGGMLLVAGGLAGLSGLGADAAFLDVAWPTTLVGIGTGLWVIAATQVILGGTPEPLVGTASAVQQAASQFGGVVGIAVLGAVMSGRVAADLPGRLEGEHVPAALADRVTRSADAVAQGHAPAGGAAEPVAAAIREAADLAFMAGWHTTFLVAAAVVALATPLALRLRRGAAQGADSSVPASRSTSVTAAPSAASAPACPAPARTS